MSEPTRRNRKKSRLAYNLTLAIVGVLSVVTIVFSISGIVKTVQSWQTQSGGKNDNSVQTPNNSNPVDDPTITDDPTDPTDTTPSEPTMPGQLNPEVTALLEDAAFIAAGYDYETAISMLTAYEGYENIEAITEKISLYEKLDKDLVVYARPDTITHVFFHSLVVDTDRAFDGDGEESGYHTNMTTVSEFIAMMEEMYARGYVLVSPYDVAYENEDGKFVYGDIRLPEGKTPFIMSQDDVNYYSYMISSGNGKNETPYWVDSAHDGFASRIVIGEDGYPTCEYLDDNGNLVYGDYDLVPVLETFIQEHPDFSYHGARAVLGVTGYEGVFGYRTKPSYEAAMGSDKYAAECQAAKEVAQCLRDHGWIIASHSYGHPAYGSISASAVESDSNKWENTVQPIVGDVDIILFPYGSDIGNWRKYDPENEKFIALYEDGYRYFFNVDGSKYWNQLGDNYFRGGRRNLDGYRMYYYPTGDTGLDDLFDVSKVWDPARPTYEPIRN